MNRSFSLPRFMIKEKRTDTWLLAYIVHTTNMTDWATYVSCTCVVYSPDEYNAKMMNDGR